MGKFPIFEGLVTWSGCSRNMVRNTTRSVEFCQNGTMIMYNTTTTAKTGLFDAMIHVHNAAKDTHEDYHFLCTYTEDQPHVATCTLTRAPHLKGPAVVTIRFKEVVPAGVDSNVPAGTCIGSTATITGNYLFDSRMPVAGTYSFYIPARPLPESYIENHLSCRYK